MTLKVALHLASLGFYVFPIAENTKTPMVPFKDQATRDPKKIKKIWIDPLMEIKRAYNIGIYCGKFKDNQALVVIDVDNKGKKKGTDTLLDLELKNLLFPETMSQTTPTGGQHLIYFNEKAIKQGVDVLGTGLDIRSNGGYIVARGSSINEAFYEMQEKEIAQCPEWIIKKCGLVQEKEKPQIDLVLDSSKINKKAIEYLKNNAPESIKGEGGDQTAYQVAAKLKDMGVSEKDALFLLMEYWFKGSGWNPTKLQIKIANAYKYGQNPLGSATAEFDFKNILTDENLGEEKHYLQEINKNYALIFLEGLHAILHETKDEKNRLRNIFYSETSFKRKFSPYTVQDGKKLITYADKWLNWRYRRSYDGLCFSPEKECPSQYFNLWSGFTCKPLPYEEGTKEQQRGLDLFLEHMKENVCADETEFLWVMTYFAHMIQKPWKKPLTTLVFKGEKGVGKNVPIERIGKLLGAKHFLVVDDSRYLTSNFNGHLDSCLMLVLDEAFWSGDKKAEGKLKGLTTGSEILIERKGKETYSVDNLLRIVILGNEAWLVPATGDERRYTVFSVGNKRKLDIAFFEEMRILLDEKEGCRLLLHYLQNFDISRININIPLVTVGLLEQKMESFSPIQQWWQDCLYEGTLLGSDFEEELAESKTIKHLREAFSHYCRERGIRSRLPPATSFGKSLRLFIKGLDMYKPRIEGTQIRSYLFPKLEIMRKNWEAHIGQKIEWPIEKEI